MSNCHCSRGCKVALLKNGHGLQVMGVQGLTRENIASHLQKYRRWLEKKASMPPGGTVSAKDWPRLEAAQSAHLLQVRALSVWYRSPGKG
jgi:hypothetical protein